MIEKQIAVSFSIFRYEELEANIQNLIEKAKQETEKSYSPYSNFAVGAAVLLDSGEVFAGSNQENASYPSGLCAERVAMFYANAQCPDNKPVAMAIAAKNGGGFLKNPITPCGSCRQALLETEKRFGSKIKVYLFGTEAVYCLESIISLLPLAFTQEQF
ncbi:MAG: cytidine deaminase [Prevotellaceae bacterium]|jgi:cytidine deaminase|nr:cytidine deaminase [Prevotellaceae bacterium]